MLAVHFLRYHGPALLQTTVRSVFKEKSNGIVVPALACSVQGGVPEKANGLDISSGLQKQLDHLHVIWDARYR